MNLGNIKPTSSKDEFLEIFGLPISTPTYILTSEGSVHNIVSKYKLYRRQNKHPTNHYIVFRYNKNNLESVEVFDSNYQHCRYYSNHFNCSNDYGAALVKFNCQYETFISIFYLKKGKIHRFNNPAVFYFYEGMLKQEEYYINGILHNRVGPAIRFTDFYCKNICYKNRFYINGIHLTLDKFVEVNNGKC